MPPLSASLLVSAHLEILGERAFSVEGSVRTEGPGVGILVFPPGHSPYAVQLCWFP